MAAEIIRQEAFEDVALNVIEHEGEEWFTSEDIRKALGFSKKDAIHHIYRRNQDEFDSLSTTVKLSSVDGKGRNQRIFNLQGVYKIGFFANTRRAKHFRHWASHMLTTGMERLRRRVLELEAARAPQLPPPDGFREEEISRLRETLARQGEKLAALKNALHLKRKEYLARILADPQLQQVFYDHLPEDLRGTLALPAPEAQCAPGSDAEPLPVPRGVLKRLHACFLHPNPRHARAGLLIVRALLDGVEPPSTEELCLMPDDLLKRDNYRKSKIWKVLAEHEDAEADQARQEIKAIALYTQAALNFYEEIFQGFDLFDREVWGIAKEMRGQ